ncbi:IMP dehydrogenase [Pyrofollis japonicus]|uniref:IMP dehydrogenase n=1 Tax=Pyrofollis japonicus TaxID=3060460 RepID=UPI00295B1B92|nr:IMP dehydrogenase [Pyrofollis japonicus]BEP18665.1 IMP dehydrogenase [Pyrofollis japonicus]
MGFKDKLARAEQLFGFDTVYLVPGRAEVEPNEVDIRTRFSRNVPLLVPVVSSPMDTVTEHELAIVLALHGALGVIHRNMPVEQQVEEVRKVKEHPPIRLRIAYLRPSDSCAYALEIMRQLGVRSLPVVDGTTVSGYVYFSELEKECHSGHERVRDSTKPGKTYSVKSVNEARLDVVRGVTDAAAIVLSNGNYVGTLLVSDALEELTPLLDNEGRLRVAAAISPFDKERALKLDKHVDALVSDVAHFHNSNVIKAARNLVKEITSDFVAGNIGTYNAAIDVVSEIERIDGLRVGIAGGSICTTAFVGGAYAPTLWAVASVRDALKEMGADDTPVIADGGIRSSGDAVKALAAGASSVMLGYVFAGTDEAAAPLIAMGEKLYKPYRGMASKGAMSRRFAADRYTRLVKRAAEGVEGLVAYKGPAAKVLKEFIEGIKAGLGYAGARNIAELWEKAVFGIAPRKYTIGEINE